MSSGSAIAAAAAVNATIAVEEVAGRGSNQMSQVAVEDAAPAIASAIQVAIDTTPEMQHVLNTETHFWQKRTFWCTAYSSIVVLVPAISAFLKYMADHTVDGKVTATVILFGGLAGYSAFRAGKATRPLGTSATQLPYPQRR